MRASRFYIATTKETPNDAELASHRLMLRAGLIKRLGSGLYTLDADWGCACCGKSRPSCARRWTAPGRWRC